MRVDVCNFCGMEIISDGTEKNQWRMLVLHVWASHDETQMGISIKETLRDGPQDGWRGEEE